MNIFVKSIDQAVSEKQLSAKIEQAKAVKIEGSPAKEVIEKIEDLLNGEESFEFVAGSNIFSETTIKLVEILDIFEKAGLNDAAYYYFIRCEEDIYEALNKSDARVRTGAYRIVGVDKTLTVHQGQTLASISRAYLGAGMECYIEAVNGGRTEFKAGDKLNIPKLELKKKRHKKQ